MSDLKINTDSKESIVSVFARLKPLSAEQLDDAEPSQRQIISYSNNCIKTTTINFDYLDLVIPPSTTQNELFNIIMPDLLDSFINGFDINLIAYGQTGSGKTHTIFGPPHCMFDANQTFIKQNCNSIANEYKSNDDGHDVYYSNALPIAENHGLLIRSLAYIQKKFKYKNDVDEYNYHLQGSMVELDFDVPMDLFNNREIISMDQNNDIIGAKQIEINTNKSIMDLLSSVELRTSDSTNMNDTSSRTHCVTMIILTVYNKMTNKIRESRLNFIDLMGSERNNGINAAHDKTKNITNIEQIGISGYQGIYSNLSLMVLRHQILSIANTYKRQKNKNLSTSKTKNNININKDRKFKKNKKLRNRNKNKNKNNNRNVNKSVSIAKDDLPMNLGVASMLSKFFTNSFERNGKTAMIITLSQAKRNGDETVCSLRYGNDIAKLAGVKSQPQPWKDYKKILIDAELQVYKIEESIHKIEETQNKLTKFNINKSRTAQKYSIMRMCNLKKWKYNLNVYKNIYYGNGLQNKDAIVNKLYLYEIWEEKRKLQLLNRAQKEQDAIIDLQQQAKIEIKQFLKKRDLLIENNKQNANQGIENDRDIDDGDVKIWKQVLSLIDSSVTMNVNGETRRMKQIIQMLVQNNHAGNK